MIRKEIQSILSAKTWALCIYIWLFYFLGLFLYCHFVWSADVYSLNYSGSDFKGQLAIYRHMDLMRYIGSPLYLLLISGLIWALFKPGLVLLKAEISNKTLINIVLLSQFILFSHLWVKIIWFVLIQGSYTQDEINNFFPFSITYFIGHSEMAAKELKALGKLNLFNILFVFFSAYCISINSKLTYIKSLIMIIFTYGLGLLLIELIKLHVIF